jgi:uncharacterized membrane protein
MILEVLIMAAIFLVPLWKIFQKAGLNPVGSLAILIPWGGFFIVTCIFAFSVWGTEKKRRF